MKGADLARQPVLTATQALQGKAAGVQIISSGKPGSSPTIRVRGVSSALAGVATLFVVDGVLTEDISNNSYVVMKGGHMLARPNTTPVPSIDARDQFRGETQTEGE